MARIPAKGSLCPDDSRFVKSARDLDAGVFRRIVNRRAKQLVRPDFGPAANERERRAQEREIQRHFEKVHKEENFLPASYLVHGAIRAQAVCRISTPRSLGSGFLVGQNLLMTNNHVLDTASKAAASRAEFGFESGQSATLVSIQPERAFVTDEELDFTIVGCADLGAGLGHVQPIPLPRNPATVTRHEQVNIIQHPAGRRKEIAIHDNRVTRVLDKVLRYRTDTEPGSSGSPVFNNEWNLVGLHHAGITQRNGAAENEGIRIPAILEHLSRVTRREAFQREALAEVLEGAADTSPWLGLFDSAGLSESESPLEIQVSGFQGDTRFADVGIWNIEHFNDEVETQRVEDVADVVAHMAMDVLGLVEVEKGAMKRLVQALDQRGFNAGFELQNVRGSQDLAVLYDRDTTTVDLRSDLLRRFRSRLGARTSTGRTAFPRKPLFAECTIKDEGGDVTFLLVLVHFKAFGDAQSRARRRLAARNLAEIVAELRESEGLPVVIGGDFNESLNTDVLRALSDSPDLFALTSDDARTDAISFVGARHRSLIDHILVTRDTRMGEIQGDDAAIVRLDLSTRNFVREVSDHVPVVFRMILRPEPVEVPPEPVTLAADVPDTVDYLEEPPAPTPRKKKRGTTKRRTVKTKATAKRRPRKR